MKKHEKQALEARLAGALYRAAPQNAKALSDLPVEQARGDEWFLEGTNPRRSKTALRRWLPQLTALAAVLLAVAGFFYVTRWSRAATVYLDVNPSIRLELNRRNRVLDAVAENADGERILNGMDLTGTDVEVALNALLGSMYQQGYLSPTKDTVLLSVAGTSASTNQLRRRLTDQVSARVAELCGSATVLEQQIDVDSDLSRTASENGISPGKAALLQRIVADRPELDLVQLASLSMDELEDYLETRNLELEDYVERIFVGMPSADTQEDDGPDAADWDETPDDDPDDLSERNGDPDEDNAPHKERDDEDYPDDDDPDDDDPDDDDPDDDDPDDDDPDD